MKCRTVPKNSKCGTTVLQEPATNPCSPVNVCLSFGRSLVWSGNCVEVRGTPTIEDGWYGQVQVVDGCIVGAREAAIPILTPAPCAPAASPCNEGGTSDITLNPQAGNLLTFVSGMLDARLYFGDSTGVTITGSGTQNDPLKFTVETDSNTVFIQSGSPSVIGVSGTGTLADPYSISLAQVSTITAGWMGAFEVDAYGRIIDYDETRTGLIEAVNNGDGVELVVEGGILTANLMDISQPVSGQKTVGGYMMTVDQKGRVTAFRQDIDIDADTYQLGSYNVTLNQYGSVTAIEPVNVDTNAIPDTFVATYKGNTSSVDTERQMTFTTEFDGPIHVEYSGFLAASALNPGVTTAVPGGFLIDIDGTALADTSLTVVGTYPATGTTNAIIAFRGVSTATITAGQHTVTVTAPTASITQTDGTIRAQVVGRGA